MVFADWLQERGDPRADGYRASVAQVPGPERAGLMFWRGSQARAELMRHCQHPGLADDWYELLPTGARWPMTPGWPLPQSRRAAEDATALAFAELSPERRAELLAVNEPAPKKLKKGAKEPKRAVKKRKGQN